MKLFRLNRKEDVHDISGASPSIAYGVILNNGKAILTWRTEYSSVAVYDSIEVLEAIHGHEGRTTVEYFQLSKPMEKLLKAFLAGQTSKKKGEKQ